jgi:hypothetical protein
MNNYIVLPSGRIIQTDDIIYVGLPHWDEYSESIELKITWASRVEETFKYNCMDQAKQDHDSLKQRLLGANKSPQENKMIYS